MNYLKPQAWPPRVTTIVVALILGSVATGLAQSRENTAFRLSVALLEGGVEARLTDLAGPRRVADGPYFYHAAREGETNRTYTLEEATVTAQERRIIVRGRLAGLRLEHTFTLPPDRPLLEEHLQLRNDTDTTVAWREFETGFTLRVTDAAGKVLPEFAEDRWAAVPFRRRAEDPKDVVYDFSVRTLLDQPGFEYIPRANVFPLENKRLASRHRFSDGWAWQRGARTVGIFSFNQEHMGFATVTPHEGLAGQRLRFGGHCLLHSTHSVLRSVAPGQTVDLGLIRYQAIEGGYNETAYAFRALLDERGCRFPADYNPPVHWEQYFDMEGCWQDRPNKYTLALLDREAAKGNEFSCEALYLDPGWDTTFGSFRWGPWLGSQKAFIDRMGTQYGLKVGLHFPVPPWASGPCHLPTFDIAMQGIAEWPVEARRQITPPPSSAPIPRDEPWICLGSRAYLDEAEQRIRQSCAAGAIFLMFDGTWWNGPCFDPRHGHPIPYRYEDHIRACLELCRRIHTHYPRVLIEMHDMLAGGEWKRMTPVYYKYGLPGSYDENWGFELMWSPMKNLQSGVADALYYYTLACNIPMYLHIALDGDNEHATALWWYASTCRHLGVGGKAKDPAIARVHQQAMKQYRQWERFYKRGEFYGLNLEAHLHVLPAERAFVVNVFNLSSEAKTVRGSIDLKTLGLDPAGAWVSTEELGAVEDSRYRVEVALPPWGSKVAKFSAALTPK